MQSSASPNPDYILKLVIGLMVTVPILMCLGIVFLDWSLKSGARSKSISWTDAPGGEIYTVRIDNHLFLTRNNQKSITHHPDCECQKVK